VAETKISPKQDPSSEAAKAEKLSPKELAALQKAFAERRLQMGPHALDGVLEESAARNQDQRQEQQLYASTWGGAAGVVAALIKVTDAERDLSRRKALEAMQAEMFELLAKEKKKDALRNSPFFKQLVSILGHDTAESITQKLEAAGSGSSSGLQANQAALAQASKDIAALLEKNQAILGLRVGGETLAGVIETEIKSAVGRIPQPSATLSLVKPEESLAVKAHEIMKGLERGDERLARLQSLRTDLGPEKFTAMVDAYDTKYGIPLVAHIATLSTSNPSLQSDMMRETAHLLTLAQQERVIEHGRAEYAQTMALLDKQREAARDNLKDVTTEIRSTERTLAATIGRSELADLPEGAVRGKILEHLAKRFPELSGKSWQDAYLRLKDVAGQSDPAALTDALRAITGGKEVHDPEALRDYIARATLQMQKLAVLDQQVDVFKNILSTNETSDEAKLRKHYSAVYGEEATTHDATYESLKKVADTSIDNLHRKIADPALGTEERAALIRERDSLEFSCVKKIAGEALHGRETPDPDAAIAVLKNFAVAYADTPARRGDSFRSVCEKLIVSIESAKTLREEWQGLDVAQFSNVELKRPTGRELISCIDGRPVKMDDMRLTERLAELDTKRGAFANSKDPLDRLIASGAPIAKNGKPVSKDTQLEVLKAQRQAALSTDFFAHILEGSVAYATPQAPLAEIDSTAASSKAKVSLDHIVAATSTLDEASAKLQKEIAALETGPRSAFLSADTQRALALGLSQEMCGKMQARNGADAVAKIIRELDPVRDLPVDREVLDAVRKAVPTESEIGKAFAAVPGGSSDVSREYEAIKGRLTGIEALRFDLLVARETDAVAQKKPSVVANIVADVLKLDPQDLYTATKESREHARLSRVERLLGALTDEEHQEFLRFFEATTQRSIGQGLIATLPGDATRSEILLRLAGSRCATSRDLQRFFGEPVPSDRAARVAALSRAIGSDSQRPAVKVEEVRQTAHTYAYQYATLRDAVRVAMGQGDVALVSEISEKMRAIEARMSGTITKTVAQLDASYVARTGLRDQLQALQEGIFQDETSRNVPGRPDLSALAKETAELLRTATPKTDAAFNRIRQANLTEEESLHLRALYARESKQPSPQLERRVLTGNLQRDLESPVRATAEERERISFLAKGGEDALREADKRTLAIAEREQNEKRQLETLSNLRATGQYDKVKDQVSSMKLTPAAREYHNAVVSGDTKKADAADLSLKAKNGDVKPQEVAAFLKDKSPSDLEKISKEYPTLAKDIAAANSFFTEQQVAQLLSRAADERRRAIEQAMLKSLTSPNEFAAWLDVQGSRDEKRQMLRNLEGLIEKQPNAPKFVEGTESKIVQYVRAQRTDFREIDAPLIANIISSRLGEPQSLPEGTVNDLLKLRGEAVRRMSNLDAFEQPRRTVYTAAQENLSEKRTYLAEAQADQGRRWSWASGGKYDNVIALTKARINEQDALVRPMTAGIRDIESSRELVRYAFALMAKDTIAQVDRGLRPELTDNVTTLLMQRDQAIQYKVTDQKRDAEWVASVKSTSEAIQSFDKWTTIGLGTAKVLTTVAAGIFFSPAAGLAVATAWNAGDKVYRGVVGKESIKSLAKSFALELAIDTAFAALSSLKTTTVTLAGGSAVKGTAAEGLKVSKRLWEFRPWDGLLKPHSIKELTKSGGNLVHSSMVVGVTKEQAKETFGKHVVVQKMAEKYFQKLGEKIPDAMLRSNWVQIQPGRFIPFIVPPSVPSSPTKTAPKLESADDGAAARKKLADPSGAGFVPPHKPKEQTEEPIQLTKPGKEASAINPTPAPAIQAPTATFEINPALLRDIQDKLAKSPDADVQQAFNNLRDAMSQTAVSIAECEQRLRELQEALSKWSPYPELANALDKILTGENPFLAFLNAPSPPPVAPPPAAPPPPPKAPPQPPPKDPGDRPGSGGGGMPGPALVSNPTARGDQQGNPRREGSVDDVRVSVADLNRATIGVASPRSELQGATMQEALSRATPHATPEARPVPQPQVHTQGQPTSSYVAVNHDLLLAEERAKVVAAVRTRTLEAEVAKRDEQVRAEAVAQREAGITETRKSRKGNEQEIAVALKESEPRGARRAESRDEAPRMVEHDAARAEVVRKGERSKVEVAREEKIEAILAQEAARSSTPQSKGAMTRGSDGVAEAHASIEAREDERRTTKVTTEIPGAPQAERGAVVSVEKESTHGVSVESSQGKVLTVSHATAPLAERSSASSVSSGRESALSVTEPLVSVTEPMQPPYSAQERSSTVHDDVLEALDSGISAPAPSKGARKLRKGDEARMRQLLLQQLMDQHTTKARREKILKALIALGISEVEYRKLLVKLGEMDAARLAEHVAARSKTVEPIAMTVDAPAMKDSESAATSPATNRTAETKAQTTRAALYKRLKEESATARK
jgi:hypothetical protein